MPTPLADKKITFLNSSDPKERDEQHALFLSRYIYDPAAFCVEVFGETPDVWQKRTWDVLLDRFFVAVRSGNGPGKTAIEAMTAIWFLLTRRLSKVPCTAISQDQMKATLWAELDIWIRKSKYVQARLNWQSEYVRVVESEASWFAVARTAMNSKGVVT